MTETVEPKENAGTLNNDPRALCRVKVCRLHVLKAISSFGHKATVEIPVIFEAGTYCDYCDRRYIAYVSGA